MIKSLIEFILVILMIFVPPLLVFIQASKQKGTSRITITVIAVLYLVFCYIIAIRTGQQNFLPFVLVIINILIFKRLANSVREEESDYDRYNFSLRTFKISKALKYVAVSYAMTFIITMATQIIMAAFNLKLAQQEVVTEAMKMPLMNYIYILPMMVVFAPVLEEFIFRWWLFENFLRPKIGIYASAILSSLVFATVHFNLRASLVIFFLGLFNCYLIHKKGYWYSVFNHFVFNSITAVAIFMQK